MARDAPRLRRGREAVGLGGGRVPDPPSTPPHPSRPALARPVPSPRDPVPSPARPRPVSSPARPVSSPRGTGHRSRGQAPCAAADWSKGSTSAVAASRASSPRSLHPRHAASGSLRSHLSSVLRRSSRSVSGSAPEPPLPPRARSPGGSAPPAGAGGGGCAPTEPAEGESA
eukprot:scaffold12267_cov120-Isochrysis_galbana.AAC.11